MTLVLGFGNDEAYTLAHAHTLQLSYFDHPPLHVWMAHWAQEVFGSRAFVRLPFVLLFAGTGWLIFALTRHIFDARSGIWALFALNVSAFFALSVGGWVVPDGPLLFCLAAMAREAALLLFPSAGRAASPWRAWLLIGLWFGLAGLSKYSAVFAALSLVAFVALSSRHRHWLAHPAPYCGALLALVIISPVVVWNSENAWVSVLFQGGRGMPDDHLKVAHLAATVAQQAFLLFPWVAIPLLIAMVMCAKRSGPSDPERFLIWLAAPTIVIFTLLPLWAGGGLPHWTMPGWFFAFPLLGTWLASEGSHGKNLRRWAVWSAASLLNLSILFGSEAQTGWIRLLFPGALRFSDPTLESWNWAGFSEALRLPSGTAELPAFIVVGTWMDGGKVDQALSGAIPVLVFSNDPRQFAFDHDPRDFIGKDAMIVADPAYVEPRMRRLSPYFERLGQPKTVRFGRNGMVEIERTLIPAYRLLSAYPLPYPQRADVTAQVPR